MNYECKIASIDDMNIKWDEEISKHPDNSNWIIWKNDNIKLVKNNDAIVYYGLLDGLIICEATAIINKDAYIHGEYLIDSDTAYLTGFRTNKEYEGMGYFSKLYKFMEDDLINKNYKHLTLGVEACEVRNMMIYFKYGFINYIKSDYEGYPDGKKILVNFYKKDLLTK